MATYTWPPDTGSGTGVTSLNSLTGALTLAAGTNITITPSGGNTLTIAASSPTSFPLLAPDGTVSAPSYSFANDTDMGLYRFASEQLAMAVAAGCLFRIRADGQMDAGVGAGDDDHNTGTSTSDFNYRGQTFRVVTSAATGVVVAALNRQASSATSDAFLKAECEATGGAAFTFLSRNASGYSLVHDTDSDFKIFDGASGNVGTVRMRMDHTTKAWYIGTPTTSVTHHTIGSHEASISFISPAFISESSNPAAAGTVRLANTDTIKFRNSGNAADISLTPGSTDNFISYAGIDLANISTAQTLTNKTIDASSNTLSNIVNANISGSAAIVGSKIVSAASGVSGVVTATTQTLTGAKTFETQLIGKGTATTNDAAAGYIGEYVTSGVMGATNAPTSGNYGDLGSIALTAGDWDVSFTVEFINASAVVTDAFFGISQTTGNSGTGLVSGDNFFPLSPPTASSTNRSSSAIAGYRQSLSGSVTIYAKMFSDYTGGPPQYRGRLTARRIR